MTAAPAPPLLSIRNLRIAFPIDGQHFNVVDGLDLTVPRGKTVALVGESGCGKSVTALSILRLLPEPPARIVSGEIHFTDPARAQTVNILDLSRRMLRRIRGNRVAMIFQEPMTALNPVYTIGQQIEEALRLHDLVPRREIRVAARELLAKVGILPPDRRARDYPHQFSGGMLQRAMIAMAVACNPALLIADEPTTALDASIQKQVLTLLRSLQHETGMSILLITHDLGVVAEFSHELNIMYAGTIVERARTPDILAHPTHPYTQALLRCSMAGTMNRSERLPEIPGQVPPPDQLPKGCRFHPRCALTERLARESELPTVSVESPYGPRVLCECVGEEFGKARSDTSTASSNHFVLCSPALRLLN